MTTSDAPPPIGYFIPAEIKDLLAFSLTGEKKSDAEYHSAVTQLTNYVTAYADKFLGYQSTAKLDTSHLARFVKYAINNIGDSFANPKSGGSQFADGYFGLNSKWIERAVLDYFAQKWHAPRPRRVREDAPGPTEDEPANCKLAGDHWLNSYWGYVLSMGSTEGNLMALRSARDYLKGRKLHYDPNNPKDPLRYLAARQDSDMSEAETRQNPVLLYSEQSHYSVKKVAQILEIEAWLVSTDEHGQMSLYDLKVKVEKVLKEGRPPIVLFNYGTTWDGALDDVAGAIAMLKPLIKEAGFDCRKITHSDKTSCWRRGFWFHVDGALGAGYASFTANDVGGKPLPIFDFRNDIMSIVMSGHKWPGAPWPTGIYMTLNKYMMTNDVPAVVGALDSTLAGSRSGIAPIFLWDWLARASDADRKAEADRALALAQMAQKQILYARRAPGSIIVTFPRPSDAIVRKYSLASITLPDGRRLSHLVCMRHVDEGLVLELIKDISRETDSPTPAGSIEDHDDATRRGW